jgi:hypothetical protein
MVLVIDSVYPGNNLICRQTIQIKRKTRKIAHAEEINHATKMPHKNPKSLRRTLQFDVRQRRIVSPFEMIAENRDDMTHRPILHEPPAPIAIP